jgi:hypothetical protein
MHDSRMALAKQFHGSGGGGESFTFDFQSSLEKESEVIESLILEFEKGKGKKSLKKKKKKNGMTDDSSKEEKETNDQITPENRVLGEIPVEKPLTESIPMTAGSGSIAPIVGSVEEEQGQERRESELKIEKESEEIKSTTAKKKKKKSKKAPVSQESLTPQSQQAQAPVPAPLRKPSPMTQKGSARPTTAPKKSSSSIVPKSAATVPKSPLKSAPPATAAAAPASGPSVLSYRDPELTEEERAKRKYGAGLNLSTGLSIGRASAADSALGGKHKRSISAWAPPPPGFEGMKPSHFPPQAPSRQRLPQETQEAERSEERRLTEDLTSLTLTASSPSPSSTTAPPLPPAGWSPFSFGFQL